MSDKTGDVPYIVHEADMSRLERTIHRMWMNKLHKMVVDVIQDYRSNNGEPPANMMAIYDYLHKKQIEKAAGVKNIQTMYRE